MNASRSAQIKPPPFEGNLLSRQYGPGQTIPAKPIFSDLKLNAEEVAEIDFRFEALKPWLKPNPPRFDTATK